MEKNEKKPQVKCLTGCNTVIVSSYFERKFKRLAKKFRTLKSELDGLIDLLETKTDILKLVKEVLD